MLETKKNSFKKKQGILNLDTKCTVYKRVYEYLLCANAVPASRLATHKDGAMMYMPAQFGSRMARPQFVRPLTGKRRYLQQVATRHREHS